MKTTRGETFVHLAEAFTSVLNQPHQAGDKKERNATGILNNKIIVNMGTCLANAAEATKCDRGSRNVCSAQPTAPGWQKIAKYVPLVYSSISFLEPTIILAILGQSLPTCMV